MPRIQYGRRTHQPGQQQGRTRRQRLGEKWHRISEPWPIISKLDEPPSCSRELVFPGTEKGAMSFLAMVFDAYGTLFDVHSVVALCEEIWPGNGAALSQL